MHKLIVMPPFPAAGGGGGGRRRGGARAGTRGKGRGNRPGGGGGRGGGGGGGGGGRGGGGGGGGGGGEGGGGGGGGGEGGGGGKWCAGAGTALRFVDISEAGAAHRVRSRPDHLFPASLVASQFAALESPVGEPGVLRVDAALSPQLQLDAVIRWLASPITSPLNETSNA